MPLNPILPLRRAAGVTATAIEPSDKSTLTVSLLQSSCEPNARKKMRRAQKKMYYHDIIAPFHSRGGLANVGGESQLPRPACEE